MHRIKLLLIFSTALFQACGQSVTSKNAIESEVVTNLETTTDKLIDPEGKNIETRFDPPNDFQRIKVAAHSFSEYLRELPLKKSGSIVNYFDGTSKPNRNVYHAVIDLPIGNRDLHQCADAVMRLRAEYLYEQEKYDSIHFNFTNGFRADYTHWKNGKRISVSGNNVQWKSSAAPSDSYPVFWKYLEMVFSYAGTASLEKEMESISLEDIRIGDVFIKGGFPGHAVIVVDMAENKTTKEKVFLLAQSYMPAQEIQILNNPNSSNESPWYSSEISGQLKTPEWTFETNQLKRFQ